MSRMPNTILGEIVEASAQADAERAIAAAIRPLISRQERAPKRGAQPYAYLAHLRRQQQAHNRAARMYDYRTLSLKAELADAREALGMTVPPHLAEARDLVRQACACGAPARENAYGHSCDQWPLCENPQS